VDNTTDPTTVKGAVPAPRVAVGPPPALSEFGLTKYRDPLRIPPKIKVPGGAQQYAMDITMCETEVQLHSELPPTTVWTYEGSFPGPTIQVRRGQNLTVTWRNAIGGTYPVTAVELPIATATAGPGRAGGTPRPEVAALPPWTVVHLHGAHTDAGNDGWTENGVLPGGVQLSEYPNDQRATTLWYHDHAMAVTALNVMAGLVGMYLIRDDEEDALDLPGGKREVPLILADRNLDTDDDGNLTGAPLYKTKVTPNGIKLPFTGPFNIVNGTIWPYLKVDAAWYRFRVVNSSSLRPYGLVLRDEQGAIIKGALHQIGTDGGLLGAPVSRDEVIVAPGERADVLVDFSAFRGKKLTLGNTLTPGVPGAVSPNPDVMQFRVGDAKVWDPFELPSTLSPSFVRLTHDQLPADHEHRYLVLTLLANSHPEMWEMVEIDQPPPVLPVPGIVQVTMADGKTKTLKRVSRTFRDAATFYVEYGGWEVWRILNLSPVEHPIHLHLVQFQTLGHGRERFHLSGFDNVVGGTVSPVEYVGPGDLDTSDQGWKDVIRVGKPLEGEMVTVAAKFTGGIGRFMYHCHILEHEDEGMMGTFVVTPAALMAVDPMPHGGDHDHGHPVRPATVVPAPRNP
jgi:spore coat protein A